MVIVFYFYSISVTFLDPLSPAELAFRFATLVLAPVGGSRKFGKIILFIVIVLYLWLRWYTLLYIVIIIFLFFFYFGGILYYILLFIRY